MVEQRPFKPVVEGSNPSALTPPSHHRKPTSAMPIDPEFLAILVCPKTKKKLRAADGRELAAVNAAIQAGTARNRAGEVVKEALQEGLVPEGEPVIYPIQDGIPVLLTQEAITLPAASA